MSFQYLLDTNTLTEPARPVPNENILYRLNIHQAEIISIAYFNDLILVINNVSDFQFFKNLRVENWFQ